MRSMLLVVVTISLLATGCIGEPRQDDGAGESGAKDRRAAPSASGQMTAEEKKEERDFPCTGGGVSEPFCAERIITVTGTIAGISELDVDLSTFNGLVSLKGGEEGKWKFVATLSARGATAEAARRSLDLIEFSWDHEEGGAHFLHVEAKMKTSQRQGAAIAAELPASLLLFASAATSNGAVDVTGVRTELLSASTSNGGVNVKASVAQAHLSTSNGAIDAELTPTSSGRLQLGTSNGAITLRVPEGGSYGYDVTGSTSNGEVEIKLKDGDLGKCPEGSEYYTPPCNHRTFRSSGFEGRSIQSYVTASTSNGAVTVRPG